MRKIGILQRLRTIRWRLQLSFMIVVLLSVTLIGAISSWASWQSARDQVENRLDMAADFKQAQVQLWAMDVQTAMANIASDDNILAYMPFAFLGTDPTQTPGTYGTFLRALSGQLERYVLQGRVFQELFLINLDGGVIMSTGDLQGQDYASQPFVQWGQYDPLLYASAALPPFDDLTVLAVHPIHNQQGVLLGLLAGRANVSHLADMMVRRSGLGETGETFLVGRDRLLLTRSRFSGFQVGQTRVDTVGANMALEHRAQGFGFYDDYRQMRVAGSFRWIPELDVALLAEQDQAEAFQDAFRVMAINIGVILASLMAAGVMSFFFARGLALPVINLAETARQIAQGDMTRVAHVGQQDEVGQLAQDFNYMTAQLRGLIGTLEERVSERTRALQKRSEYMAASSEVARAVASILNVEQLIRQVVDLIRERFNFYYVGLFLLDEAGQWAVLRAGTGPAGRAMLSRGHRIRVGEGMIGTSILSGQARIAMQADQDAARLAAPELPDTRSEAALPLKARGQTIGALTVQSEHMGAFDSDSLAVLETMADQVALALANARLVQQAQDAIDAQQRAFAQSTQDAWRQLIALQPGAGFVRNQSGLLPVGDMWRPQMAQVLGTGEMTRSGRSVGIPIKVRGRVIGVIDALKPPESSWTDAEIELIQTFTDQLNQALDSARLYQDTQRSAAFEQLRSEIASRVRATLDVNVVLRTAAQEIRSAFNLDEVEVRMGSDMVEPDQE